MPADLPHVVHVEDNLFTCSQDSQDHMKAIIREKGINRVVVASCSPRTHEPLFQETIRDAGLNKYLFEMANIRDQNTWVHMNEPARATAKAKDLVRMAVAKAAHIEPLHQVSLAITKTALVVGGGVAGMEAALGVADQGCSRGLVEKSTELGGVANLLNATWQGEPIAPYLADTIERVKPTRASSAYRHPGEIDHRQHRQFLHHAGDPVNGRSNPNGRCPRGHHPGHRRQ
jgi:heterodisulfide reductase subunit A-like polyferredoxin